MNPFPAIGRFFKKIGNAVKDAFTYAASKGLTDELLGVALRFIRDAEASLLDNAAKREMVVDALAQRFPQLPESILRMAVEAAFQLFKREIDAHLPS